MKVGFDDFIRVGCIVVLYNPDLNILKDSLNSVKDQVEGIFISDNSQVVFDQKFLDEWEHVFYEKMPGNIGIAAAQNVGIRYFMEKDFTHIIFLDQDSIMEKGLVSQLLQDLKDLESKSMSVGAIGPRAYHKENNKEYRGSVKKGKLIEAGITEVTELISSSTLVPLKNYRKVGLMDEMLFIDGVDHEWCWRAHTLQGLRFFISEKVSLSHQLGEGDRFFLVRNVAIPTPFRTYYQYRNYFILIRRKYVPVYWKFANGFKYLIKLFYYPLFLGDRRAYLKNMWGGIKDGLLIRNSLIK